MNKKVSKLENSNRKTINHIEEKITELVRQGQYLSLDNFLDLEWTCQAICVDNFSSFFGFDIHEFVDVKIKIYLEKGLIGIFPGNLFTSLLMKNKLIDSTKKIEEEDVLKMNLDNMYKIDDVSYKFDNVSNSIMKIHIH
jgi:hypothetical protein